MFGGGGGLEFIELQGLLVGHFFAGEEWRDEGFQGVGIESLGCEGLRGVLGPQVYLG